MTKYKIGEFKGNPTFSLLTGIGQKDGKEYWLTFGVRKAKAIMDVKDEIAKFIKENDRPSQDDGAF